MSARLLRKVLEEQERQQRSPDLEFEAAGPEAVAGDGEDRDSSISAAQHRNPFDLLDEEEKDELKLEAEGLLNHEEEQNFASVKNNSHEISFSSTKSKKKKKKKNKGNSASAKTKEEKSIDVSLEDLSSTSKSRDLGEIIESRSSKDQMHLRQQNTSTVLSVDPKFLKAENELRKIFGSKVVKSFENSQIGGSSRQMHGGRRTAYNPRKSILISPAGHWPKWDGSLSMELLETKGGINYFRYVYSQAYIHVQDLFEDARTSHDLGAIAAILAHHPYHIEALLTFAEVFKFSGEHQSAADAIGKCLFALECAWHPLFSPMQGNCQIKYNHDRNKPIFTALFSHMKNLDRQGCHRSALEVCKLLLSLDSDDPVGALFLIDHFSIRAEEYAWLEEFSEEYKSDSSIWLFPNFSFSLAIAFFYLEQDATHRESDRSEKATSSDLMKQALMLHPLVLKELVSKAPLKDPAWTQILKNPYFGSAKAGGPTLDHLIDIYVERNSIIWRFPELQKFLKESSLHVIESLKCDASEVKNWTCVRKEAFASEKNEYAHLLTSDFSHSTPSIPPEEVRHFMVDQHVAREAGGANIDAGARELRELVGRNPVTVFLESLLPWVDHGANIDRQNGRNPDNA